MIQKINNRSHTNAKNIRAVFLESYAIEAQLLQATYFPPLHRPLKSYIDCDNDFYGYYVDTNLAAIIEIKLVETYTHIQSLVVLPTYFRRGIAQQLIQFILDSYKTKEFMVETGVDNTPACTLYKKMGFKEVLLWDTEHEIRKIRFKKWH